MRCRAPCGAWGSVHANRPSVVYASMAFVDGENQKCYDNSPERKAEPSRKILVHLLVDGSGAVTSAVPDPKTTFKDPKTIECMLANVRKVRFPKRDGVPPAETGMGFIHRPKKE